MQDVQEDVRIWLHWHGACLPCMHEGPGSIPSTSYGGTHMQLQHVGDRHRRIRSFKLYSTTK